MKLQNTPSTDYAFGYKNKPQSGNEINGLGEAKKIRARHVFHNATGEPMPWDAIDTFFSYINLWGVVRHMLGNVWQLRRQDGPVSKKRLHVDDPTRMAEEIKAEAKRRGAGIVGVTKISDDMLYEGHEVPYKYAISIGLPMRRDKMVTVPHGPAAVEVMRAYKEVSRVAIELGEHIRGMGYEARAYGNPNSTDILHIPIAISAGLGELGKHGSMISKEYGSNFRLAAVLTNLPLVADAPVDLGVQDVCATCQRCVMDCPPDAIFPEKQLVRGVEKWYVDFDKCVPYFTKTYGCAICIEVCPWSEPERGSWLSEKMLGRRVKENSSE